MDEPAGDERLPGRGQGRLSPARRRYRRAAGDARRSSARRRTTSTIRVLASDMTVMVRADRADEAGIRRVIGPAEVEALLAVLRGDDIVIPGNWNRRFKHNREKMRSGDVLELAEVIRNLANRGVGQAALHR